MPILTLTRKYGQTIHVGKDIIITVTSIGEKRVRLSIEAPEDVHILRGEIIDRDWDNRGVVSDET